MCLPSKSILERYAQLITALISTLFGVLLGYFIQKKLHKKNDWINNFRNNISELLSLHFNMFNKLLPDEKYKQTMYNVRPDNTEYSQYEDKVNFYSKLLIFYLNEKKPLHIELKNLLEEIYNRYKNIRYENKNNYNKKDIEIIIEECFEKSKEIIKQME